MILQTASGMEVLSIEGMLDAPRSWPPEDGE